ncbi:MAG: type I-C CRISPR-associated endonuclease Cas1 [Syntrophomonadaceae bacterium]|nr:type I-C CRISPR-associated endonuclease Cas1 [Syntrophomonadaceae bacterium]
MRRLLNTLYVTTPDSYLARDGENIIIRMDEEILFRVPVHNIEAIVYFGYPGASPSLLGLCAERGVTVSFMNLYGKFLARIEGPQTGNVLLRRKQYRLADEENDLPLLAKYFVAAKIMNCRAVLQRGRRDHPERVGEDIDRSISLMANSAKKVYESKSLNDIRGLEGESAQKYFSEIDHLILEQKDDFFMNGRSRRPPMDRFNTLLSFFYTLLVHECRSALESVGLDPSVGYLHRDRPGRPSLALDLMEELRPYLADRMVLSLINRKQISQGDFTVKENGAVYVTSDARKTLLTAWQKRKQEEIIHPYLEEKIPIGLLPYTQALLLARFLRGDLDGYPAFIWK